MSFERTKALSSQIFQLLKELYSRNDISNLEKDLLKEKLRQLYDIINEWPEAETEHSSPTSADTDPKIDAVKEDITESTEIEKSEDELQNTEPVTQSLFAFEEPEEEKIANEPIVKPLPIEKPAEPIAVESDPANEDIIEDVSQEEEEEEESPEESKDDMTVSDVEEEPANMVPSETEVKSSNGAEVDEEVVMELFEMEVAKELSDKLSQSPISDLTKALGINDRLLTVNELFGGDFSSFDESFRKLNTMDSFEEAKSYLMEEIVLQHNWIDPSKKARAKRFIKFVRRRYLN